MKEFENTNGLSDNEEDEWYHNSIKRYNELFMFDLEHPIQSLDLSDPTGLCILSETSSLQQIISLHSLPVKIVRQKIQQNKVTKDTDMKVKSGIFPEANVFLMCSLYGQDTVLTSEMGLSGFNIYRLNSSGTDRIEKFKSIIFPLATPNFALVNSNELFVTKDSTQISRVIDLSTGNTKCCLNTDASEVFSLSPVVMSEHVAGLCKESKGEVRFYDLKTGLECGKIEGHSKGSKYNCNSNYKYTDPKDEHIVGIFSTDGAYSFYDNRNFSQKLISGELNWSCGGSLKTRFSPNGKCVSVSGCDDGTVKVYSLGCQELNEEFCHDGHKHMEHCDKNPVITDHLWYDHNCLISGASNNSLNCWQYNQIH